MSVFFRIILLASLALAAGCWSSTPPAPPPAPYKPPPVKESLGGEHVLNIIREAEKAEAFRLKDNTGLEKNLGDYIVTSGPIALSEDLQKSWAKALTTEQSYNSLVLMCEPDYGVRIQFTRAGEKVDVLLCYSCRQIDIYHNDKGVGGNTFFPAFSEFLRLAKATFPNDKSIQQLSLRSPLDDEDEPAPKPTQK